MKYNNFCIFIIIFVLQLSVYTQAQLLTDYKQQTEPISFENMQGFLNIIARAQHIDMKIAGKSVSRRPIYLIHLAHKTEKPVWKVFLYAQQHGNEPAGKDALLHLAHQFYLHPEKLPDEVELWIMPLVNPDGADANKRRNDNNADLNRDHQLLLQPETQTLHQVFREIMPHVAVDCHEFTRDSEDYSGTGWQEWPLIMMDCGNNPLIDAVIYETGQRWCEQVRTDMLEQGYNYTRYYVGGVPPNDELRHSTLEMDDARNGLAAYGGLSFIIESGVLRNSQKPNLDLGQRISAYFNLLSHFIYASAHRSEDIAAIFRSRSSIPSKFIPTNYFWANHNVQITQMPVIDKKTGSTILIQTPNFMHDIIIKNSVPAPGAYLIAGDTLEIYKSLLDRHAIDYEILKDSTRFFVEISFLKHVENKSDSLYNRYAGRQIIEKTESKNKVFLPGALKVKYSRRSAMLLEPLKLYGLYQHDLFIKTIGAEGEIPVYRMLEIN